LEIKNKVFSRNDTTTAFDWGILIFFFADF
jgi:hypothetical protein